MSLISVAKHCVAMNLTLSVWSLILPNTGTTKSTMYGTIPTSSCSITPEEVTKEISNWFRGRCFHKQTDTPRLWLLKQFLIASLYYEGLTIPQGLWFNYNSIYTGLLFCKNYVTFSRLRRWFFSSEECWRKSLLRFFFHRGIPTSF